MHATWTGGTLETESTRKEKWLLVFDDGTETGGPGAPPATVKHTYAARRRLPGDADRLPVPAVHDGERPLLHLGRRHRRHDAERRC